MLNWEVELVLVEVLYPFRNMVTSVSCTSVPNAFGTDNAMTYTSIFMEQNTRIREVYCISSGVGWNITKMPEPELSRREFLASLPVTF